MRAHLHLAFDILAAFHAFKLALLILEFWVLCDFAKLAEHLP